MNWFPRIDVVGEMLVLQEMAEPDKNVLHRPIINRESVHHRDVLIGVGKDFRRDVATKRKRSPGKKFIT